MVTEKEERSLSLCGKTLPKFRWDRERMRVISTPSTRGDGKKTLSDPEDTIQKFVARQAATASCWSGSKAR